MKKFPGVILMSFCVLPVAAQSQVAKQSQILSPQPTSTKIETALSKRGVLIVVSEKLVGVIKKTPRPAPAATATGSTATNLKEVDYLSVRAISVRETGDGAAQTKGIRLNWDYTADLRDAKAAALHDEYFKENSPRSPYHTAYLDVEEAGNLSKALRFILAKKIPELLSSFNSDASTEGQAVFETQDGVKVTSHSYGGFGSGLGGSFHLWLRGCTFPTNLPMALGSGKISEAEAIQFQKILDESIAWLKKQ